MEEKRELVKREASFLDNAVSSIESMREAAQIILDSKLCPDHFFEKGADNKPDYSKGNVASVMLVGAKGAELGMSTLMALQHIVPINGLLAIKGDAMRAIIFQSNKIKKGSWKEEITGSIDEGTYQVSITATRNDTDETMTRTFSVNDAKRSGLWITDKQINSSDGYKWKKSAWYRFPTRMIYYRCLSYLGRDLFSDVVTGCYTLEEAVDIPQDTTEVITTSSGASITIPDKQHAGERSENLTSKVGEKIAKNNVSIPEAEEVTGEQEQEAHVYTEFELSEMGPRIYDEVEKLFPDLVDKLNAIPGKNTNKKWRLGVLALQAGRFKEYASQTTAIEEKKEGEGEPPVEKTVEDEEFEANMGDSRSVDLPQNKEKRSEHFAKSEGVKVEKDGIIHHQIIISVLPESGARSFPDTRQIFQGLQANGMDEDTYKKVASELVVEATGETFISAYTSMQLFSKHATAEQVVELIDVFMSVNS